MIDLIAAAGIGGIIGMGIMAWRTHGKVAGTGPLEARVARQGKMIGTLAGKRIKAVNEAAEAHAAHTRCADALTCTQRKLSAIRDLVGPTEGLRRGRLGQIAAILDGERV